MEERRKNLSVQTQLQVKHMRRLYSQIGEPLPVDIIIDLHRYLPAALDLAQETKSRPGTKKRIGKHN